MGTSDTASVIDFTSYMSERTRNFIGREWVFQAIQAWLADAHGPRFFLLTGDLLKPVYTRAGGELTDPQEGCKLKDIKIKTSGEQPCLGVRQ
jgi:hypothetical protein